MDTYIYILIFQHSTCTSSYHYYSRPYLTVSVTPQSALRMAQPQSGWHNTGIFRYIYLRRRRAVHERPTHFLAIGASPRDELVAVKAHQVDLRRPNFIYNHS